MLGVSPPIVGEGSIFGRIQERREKIQERLKHIREKLKHNKEKVINEGLIPTVRTKIEEITLKVRERVNPNLQPGESTTTTYQTTPPVYQYPSINLTKETDTNENQTANVKQNKLAF